MREPVLSALELFRLTAEQALAENRTILFEHELFSVLRAAGIAVPRFHFIPFGQWLPVVPEIGAVPAVVKVVSEDILHKSDAGGVQFLLADEVTPEVLRGFHDRISNRYEVQYGRKPSIAGTLIAERVCYDPARVAGETIAGMKWNADFGFVGLIGLGGVKAELMAGGEGGAQGSVIFSVSLESGTRMPKRLCSTLAYRDLAGQLRGSSKLVDDSEWVRLMAFLSHLAKSFPVVAEAGGHPAIAEIEFNPVVANPGGRLVALDALCRLARSVESTSPRPLQKLSRFFRPETIAIAGVSSKAVNMGRVILRNLLRDSFPRQNIFLIKPGDREIDGVTCYANPQDLPRCADLAVLAVNAAAVPGLIAQLVSSHQAENIIAIPGGMAEKRGGEDLQNQIMAILRESRSKSWLGPLVCGPNSMGVLSMAGGYDTTFIPETKFRRPEVALGNVAYISQSGAFMLSRISNVPESAPRYMVSAGNQVDLTISDYLYYLKDDPEVRVLAVYVEGFQQLDGLKFLQEAQHATLQGKTVILYKGGRSAEGRGAAAGHTASIAGDYRVTKALAADAGILVTETLREFEGCVRLASLLVGKTAQGCRVGLMSNAGFQTVAMADNLRSWNCELEIARFESGTLERLRRILAPSGIDSLINLQNPLDITPAADDSVFCDCVQCLIEDPAADAVIAAIVPFSPAMATLGSSTDPQELITRPDSIARRLPSLAAQTAKPLIAVVEGGKTYEALVEALQSGGMPVFRAADEAIQALGKYIANRRLNTPL